MPVKSPGRSIEFRDVKNENYIIIIVLELISRPERATVGGLGKGMILETFNKLVFIAFHKNACVVVHKLSLCLTLNWIHIFQICFNVLIIYH